MFVCLCTGATNKTVADAVAGGASTCKEVARACGAGADCGRCWRTVRAIIASNQPLGGNRCAALAREAHSVRATPGDDAAPQPAPGSRLMTEL